MIFLFYVLPRTFLSFNFMFFFFAFEGVKRAPVSRKTSLKREGAPDVTQKSRTVGFEAVVIAPSQIESHRW